LAQRAAADFGFDLRDALVIGDKPCDIELGRNCGASTVLVRTGYGRAYEAEGLQADIVADDLFDAARSIERRMNL
jgi:D-glycero-D-manno-heptose 1,7-bisphosphate phosphatase